LRWSPLVVLIALCQFIGVSGEQTVQKYEILLLEEIGRKRLVKTRVVVGQSPTPHIPTRAEQVLAIKTSGSQPDDYRPPLM